MRVYLGQHPATLLLELARYAYMLMKIANKSKTTSGLSKYKARRSSSRPCSSPAYAVEMSCNIIRDNVVRETSKISIRLFDDKRQWSLPLSSNNILYSRLCLEKTHSL